MGYTCVSLLDSNYNILIIDSLVNSFETTFETKKNSSKKGFDKNERIQFIKGDLRDKLWLDSIFKEYIEFKKAY